MCIDSLTDELVAYPWPVYFAARLAAAGQAAWWLWLGFHVGAVR